MHVLICDDDASTRFVIKRLLTQHLGCTTSECDDGVETLRKLDEGDTDLVVLDVEMPFLDGVEVLEAIRASARWKSLPVLMLSKERREDIVLRLVRLGIEGYVLKPPRTEKVLAALERVRTAHPVRSQTGTEDDTQTIRLAPDSPALLIDGNADYRRFFVSQGSVFGPIVEAASGAAALSQFRQSPTRLVFLGQDIGVLGPDLLIPKLRGLAGQPIRIIGIVNDGETTAATGTRYDHVIVRSLVPETLTTALRCLTDSPGAGAPASNLIGGLSEGISNAVRQVFGMMLDAELEAIDATPVAEPMIAAVSAITVAGRQVVRLGVRATVDSMTVIAGRMLGMQTTDVGVEDYLSTCSELANLVGGRMHASLEERSMASECALPVVEREPAVWDIGEVGADGLVLRFRTVGSPAEILVSVSVDECSGDALEPVPVAVAS